MKTIKFYRGEENGIVVEHDNYEDSIFRDQYVKALLTVNRVLAQPSDREPGIVAFCGDRGEGKSSCMETVAEMLRECRQQNSAAYRFISEHKLPERGEDGHRLTLGMQCGELMETQIEELELIDPAFFDHTHNVLELVLGQMFEHFLTYTNAPEHKEEMKARREDKENLMACFHDAKLCWSRISKGTEDRYDPLEELDSLAAGLAMRKHMAALIEEYLKFFHKDQNGQPAKSVLMVKIDDLDLNINEAYVMAEQIRKYLVSPQLLLLISLNASQMVDVIANYLDRLTAPSKDLGTQQMATKYVTKLIPLEMRVIMPKMYDLCNMGLEVYDKRGGRQEQAFHSVKEAVVKLTYDKTRFLFYNSKGGISPLVPNNLRSLRHLVGMLLSMTDFTKNEESISNKNAFRSYFYQTWTRQLKKSDQEFAALLVKGDDATSVNKLVVSYLKAQIDKLKGSTNFIDDISNPVNYSYNVSVGDVFYMINYLERSNVEEDLKQMLFFIKSFYSMRLYEYYDVITEQEGELSPEATLQGEVYKSDAWFKRTNMLQRFVNGSYFTYTPADLLPPTAERKNRDLKSYRGNMLYKEILSTLKDDMNRYDEMDEGARLAFEQRFRIAEFFAFTVKKAVSRRKVESVDRLRRDYSEPFHLTDFNTNTFYLVFDVMAPFYNIVNPKYTYERFSYLRRVEGSCKGFYEFAISHDWSLLRSMIDHVRVKDHNEAHPDQPAIGINDLPALNSADLEEALKRLSSNACIRNGEVLSAVMEAIQSRRDNWHNRKDSLKVLHTFYGNIINSEMRTYDNIDTERPYVIRFVFLEAIRDLLNGRRTRGQASDDMTLLAAIYNSDYNTDSISDDDILSEYHRFFNGFKTSKKGKMVKADFARLYPDFYKMSEESSWDEWFKDDDSYNKATIIKTLRDRFTQYMSQTGAGEANDIDEGEDEE